LTQYVGHPFLVVSARSPLSHPSILGIGADPAHNAAVGPNRRSAESKGCVPTWLTDVGEAVAFIMGKTGRKQY